MGTPAIEPATCCACHLIGGQGRQRVRAPTGTWHHWTMVERVIAACDGASKGNPGPAGWAFVLADSEGVPQRWQAGPLGINTNNVGELTALEQLLLAADPAVPLEVRLDSTYTRDAVGKWLVNWKRNGFKNAAGKPVANREIIERIDALLTGRDVTFVYVPAHRVDGDPLNAIADRAASDAAKTQQPAGGTGADTPLPAPGSAAGPEKAAGARRAARPSGAARTGTGGGTLKAKFPGTCAACSKRYGQGEPISRVGSGWGHSACAAAATDG